MNQESFSRLCTFCNLLLEPAEERAVYSKVPPYVYETLHHFYQCDQCKRSYWQGSHKKLFGEQLEKILRDLPLPPN